MSELTKEERASAASHLRFAADAYAKARSDLSKTINLFPSGSGLVSAKSRELISRGCSHLTSAIDECDALASKLEASDE